jgi:hypothetical protein
LADPSEARERESEEWRQPKHRGGLADRDLGRLLQDFERAERNAENADAEVPYEFFRRMRRSRRDWLAQEIDRRILP